MVFTCKQCGKVFATKSRIKRLFCSERCRELYHYNHNYAPMPEGMACNNNPGVFCEKKDNCELCGWNPAVSARRIREALEYGAD